MSDAYGYSDLGIPIGATAATDDYQPGQWSDVINKVPAAIADHLKFMAGKDVETIKKIGSGIAHAVDSALTLPQRMTESSERMRTGGVYDPAPFVEGALTAIGGSPFTAVKGAAGVFGGRLAQTADLGALKQAETMFSKGHGSTDIWEQTGWHRGPDQQWRFEIPDTAARVTSGEGHMADVLHHPELYKAYPDLAKVEAGVGNVAAVPGTRAQYQVPDRNFPERFDVFAGEHDPRSSMLHEVQHAIQEREGFARGSNPMASDVRDIARANIQNERAAAQTKFEELSAARDKWLNDYAREHNIDLRSGEGYQQANKAHNAAHAESEIERDKLFGTYTAWGGPSMRSKIDTYRKFAGEVEARNVQERLKLTPEEMQVLPPNWTQDTPVGEQFVSMKNPTMGALAEP